MPALLVVLFAKDTCLSCSGGSGKPPPVSQRNPRTIVIQRSRNIARCPSPGSLRYQSTLAWITTIKSLTALLCMESLPIPLRPTPPAAVRISCLLSPTLATNRRQPHDAHPPAEVTVEVILTVVFDSETSLYALPVDPQLCHGSLPLVQQRIRVERIPPEPERDVRRQSLQCLAVRSRQARI